MSCSIADKVADSNIASNIKNNIGNRQFIIDTFGGDSSSIIIFSDMFECMSEDIEYFCTKTYLGPPMFSFAICSGKVSNIQDINLCDFFKNEYKWKLSINSIDPDMFDLHCV